MSQLGAMLQHLGRLLESGGDGAINWDLARDTAEVAAAPPRDGVVGRVDRLDPARDAETHRLHSACGTAG